MPPPSDTCSQENSTRRRDEQKNSSQRTRRPFACLSLARPRALPPCVLEPSGIWLLGDFRRGQPLFGSWFVGLGWLPVTPLFGWISYFSLGFLFFDWCVFGSWFVGLGWLPVAPLFFFFWWISCFFFFFLWISCFLFIGFGGFPVSLFLWVFCFFIGAFLFFSFPPNSHYAHGKKRRERLNPKVE